MNFGLNELQSQLQDATARLLRECYGFEQRQRICAGATGWSSAFWQNLADLGLLGVALPERCGGSAAGFRELCVVSEQLGRHLAVEPYVPVVAVAATLVQALGSRAQQDDLLTAIAAGKRLAVLAHGEPDWRDSQGRCDTVARATGDAYVLDGHKAVVLGGGSADTFLVSARLDGSERVAIFIVDAHAPGVQRRSYPIVGGGTGAELHLSSVRLKGAAVLGAIDVDASTAIDRALDLGTAAICSEAVGTMQTLFELTLEHIKTRRQFGAPLGALQVVQHKAVDMLMALELARSMATLAAELGALAEPAERRRLVSAAKVQIDQSARTVAQNGVQLHGGIGITMECAAAHCMARLTAIGRSYGDVGFHLTRYAG